MIFALVCLRVHFLMIFNSVAFNHLVRDLCENLIKAMGLLLKDKAKHTHTKPKTLRNFTYSASSTLKSNRDFSRTVLLELSMVKDKFYFIYLSKF